MKNPNYYLLILLSILLASPMLTHIAYYGIYPASEAHYKSQEMWLILSNGYGLELNIALFLLCMGNGVLGHIYLTKKLNVVAKANLYLAFNLFIAALYFISLL